MKTSILLFSMLFSATLAFFQTSITSTEKGGDWERDSTWVGGIVPTSEDNVAINGPVRLMNYDNKCHNITVNSDKSLWVRDWYGYLKVYGDLVNNGTVSGGMDITLFGNLENYGLWEKDISGTPDLIFKGTDQYISHAPGYGFHGAFMSADSNVNIRFNSDIHLYNENSVLGGAEIYTEGYNFKIDNGALSGARIVSDDTLDFNTSLQGGNEITGDFVLKGTVTAFNTNILRGTATVLDTIQTISGPYFLTIDGNINNYGSINTSVHISGNIDNHGSWNAYETYFTGGGEKTISQSPDADFEGYFHMDDPETTLTLASDVLFNMTDFELNGATLNCGPYNLTAGSRFVNGTIISYGDITQHNYYELVTFEGNMGFHGINNIKECTANGDITNYDTISQPYPIPGNYLTVNGTFVNKGLVIQVPVNLYGNLTNDGEINTANIIVQGDSTQYITLSQPVNEQVIFRAMVDNGSAFQWMKDGEDIPGAATSELNFNTLQLSDKGVYKCRVETSSKETVYSREIIVNLSTGMDDNPFSPTEPATLFRNYPNPFQNATVIPYRLQIDSKVELTVTDMSGNLVRTLINKTQRAGKYEIRFAASGLPSGIYYYSLFIDGKRMMTKKMALIR